jgi:hypothetical protein
MYADNVKKRKYNLFVFKYIFINVIGNAPINAEQIIKKIKLKSIIIINYYII